MKTCWHQHPETVERLAAEYALGTLVGAARRRMRTLMSQRPDVAQAVWSWHDRLGGALSAQQPVPVRAGGWNRLEARLFGKEAQAARATDSWWQRWLAPIPAGALVVGLLLGMVVVPLWESTRIESQLPESYVGVLADQNGKPGLIVSSLRRGKTVDFKQLSAVEVPAGSVLLLWTIDLRGEARPVLEVPQGPFVSAPLHEPAESVFFAAVELAVSVERAGGWPSSPSGPFVYRGLCGKLWKLPAGR